VNFVLQFYRQSWRLLFFSVVTGLAAGLSGAGMIVVIGKAMSGEGKSLMLEMIFVGLCVTRFACKSGSELALLHISQDLVLQLRVSLSRKLLVTPQKQLQALGKPGLLTILTDDIATFAQCSQLLPLMFSNAVLVIACLSYIGWLSWHVLLLVLLFLVFSASAFKWAERTPLRRFSEVREEMEVLYKNFRSLIEGSKELQLNKERGNFFLDHVLRPGVTRLQRLFTRGMAGYTWIVNIGTMQFFVAIGLLLFVVPVWLPGQVSVLSTVTLMLLYMVQPISDIMTSMPYLQQARIALRKAQQLDASLTDVGDTPADVSASPAANPFGASGTRQGLMLQAIRHTHDADPSHPFSLGPLDLHIPFGEITFIIGGNGSGKTTLALLLLGLYAPDEGALALNDVLVTPDNIESYRSQFSAMFSDFHLFEQLLHPLDERQHMWAQHYLRLLEIEHKVRLEGTHFSTTELSTGQRKRLALVASYLEDRPIYLFDEWASDQDPAFKRVFYTRLLPDLKARGKTVIVITHDDAYYDTADHVIKLRDNRLEVQQS